MSFALVAAACGGSDDSSSDTTTGGSATTAASNDTGSTTATTAAGVAQTTTTVAQKPKPQPGGKIVIGVDSETGGAWVPAAMQCDSSCQLKIRTVLEPLAAFDNDAVSHPYLAESITPNADYTAWTIKVRPNITFHDGTPLNADAVLANLNANLNGILTGAQMTGVKFSTDAAGAKVLDATKVDDTTVTINMLAPWVTFDRTILTGQAGFVASPTWLAKAESDQVAKSQPVGTGPFVYSSYAAGNNFVVKKNPNYWRKDADGVQLPYLDEVEFRVIPDGTSRASAMRKGDVDAINLSSGDEIKKFREQSKDFPMIEADQLGETAFAQFNFTALDGAFTDKNLRCALVAATPRDEVNDAVQSGVTKVANGVFSPTQPGYLADNGLPKYDKEAAKKFLDAYKATGKAVPKIKISTTTDQGNGTIAQIFQAAWAEVGIESDVIQMEQGALITNAVTASPDFQVMLWRIGGGYLDNNYFWWHTPADTKAPIQLNFGRIYDPKLDAFLDANRAETDAAKRKTIAEDMNRYMASECLTIPYWWSLWAIPHSPAVQGIADTTIPDGSNNVVAIGQGFPGSFLLNQVWIKK
ncbi:MAG: ABC transporter substrate-binding protein [Acidimicrobiia bacterium]